MTVNELDRDYLQLLHMCDQIENIQNGIKMQHAEDTDKKSQVGNMVMHLEMEALDDKWEAAGKDMTRINDCITSGRTYWKA